MPDVGSLINGFRVFKSAGFQQKKDIIHHLLVQGHQPTTLVISCCSIRMSPAEIFATNPGDLYIVNNVGGLVPKYESEGIHGFISAIEYAVVNLEVQNIVVLGHRRSHSIKMMMSDDFVATKGKGLSESMKSWLSTVSEARDAVKKELEEKSEEEQLEACEQEAIIVSLRNLLTYPYVKNRIKKNNLNIFGWHFNAETCDIKAFNPDTRFFEQIT